MQEVVQVEVSIPLEVRRWKGGRLHSLLNLLEALLPLLPVVHDRLGLGLLGEGVGHLLHLLLALLDVVDTDVGDERDVGTHGRSSAGLAVLDGDALFWFDAELLACVDVDGWVWLGRWWVEGGDGRVDVLVREEAYSQSLVWLKGHCKIRYTHA